MYFFAAQLSTWAIAAIVLYSLIAISMVVSLLLYGMRPSKTLAWLLAIFTIPVGGMLLYLVLGRNKRRKKFEKKQGIQASAPIQKKQAEIIEGHKGLHQLILKNSGHHLTEGNFVTVLRDGQMTFSTIFAALESATRYIHILYYIFEEGELTERLFQLFERKIKEGVAVRLIYDGIGSFSLSRSYQRKLEHIGVAVFSFLPFRLGHFLTSVNYRNHRKIIVVDGHTAFTGGINVSDKYLRGDKVLGKWHDTHLKIEGAAAHDLDTIFAADYKLASGSMLALEQPAKTTFGNHTVQVVASGPQDDFAAIEQTYFYMITQAKAYVYIANPYIIPNLALYQALTIAALSGIEVRLLLSEKTDSKLVGWCVRSYFEGFLKSGVRIFLYPEGFLHSKLIICDDSIASIGTANLDERSFQHNYEVNAMLYSSEIAQNLGQDFRKDCALAKELRYTEYAQRPAINKLKEGAARIFSPLL